MKKIISILILIVCIGLVGCGNGNSETARDEPSIETSSAEHDYVAYEPELQADIWVIRYFVDQFNQQTDERFIVNDEVFEGVFSNSATTDSRLTARILVDNENIAIVLYEYGNRRVVNGSSVNPQHYNITMRTPSDNRRNMTGTMLPGGNRILIDAGIANHGHVLTALRGTGTVDFFVEQSDRTIVNYLFHVPSDNFDEIYILLR